MILSIIIPVYNVEKYVEKCIRSCESQDIPQSEYEIIVVNDGSKDNSLQIVNRLSGEYNNIKVISQPNGGLSAARNTGMKNANGQYFMFVDSDDWIATNCLKSLTAKLRDESPDLLAICAANVIEGMPVRRFSYEGKTKLTKYDMLKRGKSPCAPFSIWNRDFLFKNDLKFLEGIFHEDSEFTPRAYYLAEKISFTNDIIYYVFQNPNSITRSINPKKAFDYIEFVCPSLFRFANKVLKEDKYIYYDMIGMYINNALSEIICSEKEKQDSFLKQLNKNDYLFKAMLHSSIIKYKLESILFILFPMQAITFYKFLKLF